MENLPAVSEPREQAVPSLFSTTERFEQGQRMCKLLSTSNLVPPQFQGNVANTFIALELANRTASSPFFVMQNLHVIHGRPSWSAQFIIAALNTCGRFSPLRFEMSGEGDGRQCVAWAIELASGERLEGPPVSLTMAKEEGWSTKAGSKWKSMPELMLRYRAATFFGRLYAPDILMGMRSSEELFDYGDTLPEAAQAPGSAAAVDELLSGEIVEL